MGDERADEDLVRTAAMELADLFRRYDEPRLAEVIERSLAGEPDELPARVLMLFQHGMGGLLDRDLYRNGVHDADATARRNVLAERLYDEAKQRAR
jgi:hypothetical protein